MPLIRERSRDLTAHRHTFATAFRWMLPGSSVPQSEFGNGRCVWLGLLNLTNAQIQTHRMEGKRRLR